MTYLIENSINVPEYVRYLEEITNSSLRKDYDFANIKFSRYFSVNDSNYILIRGENYSVLSLMKSYSIKEKNIIMITCTVEKILNIIDRNGLRKKNIYIPKYSKGGDLLTKYKGEKFGFEFDLSLAEIKMYRDKDKRKFRENLLEHFDRKRIESIIK